MEEIQSSFECPQVQPLTTTLKNICRDYPAGGAILRELLQNADDAGASIVRFILDNRTYANDVLINPELGQYQGPALLAYNNAKFSEADYKSLSRIGDSLKLEDGEKTGKFGRGFDSVYHWTDSPCIVSGEKLLIHDPHNAWSPTGGPGFNFVSNAGKVAMKNQMAAYAALMKHPDRAFDGTIVRIPLRTEAQASKSRISTLETTATEVMDVLCEFAAEFKNGGLLFLRNVEKLIIVSETGPIIAIELKNYEEARRHKALVNDAVKAALARPEYSFDHSFELDIEYTAGGELTKTRFAVHHSIQGRYMDRALRTWSVAQKYIPWVAVAAKLPEEETESFQGSLFTVLPLPIPTNEPVHIHGQFSLSPDRARLHRSRDKSSQDQAPGLWNEWLFNNAIPTAWAKVLNYIAPYNSSHTCFGMWPSAINDPTSLFHGVVEKVVSVIERDSSLWYTQVGNVSASTGILGHGEESKALMDALIEAKVPIVQVPGRLRPVTEHLFVDRTLTPQTLCMFLNDLGSTQVRALSVAAKQTILEFLFSDPGFSAYGDLELFPFEDGTHRAIRNHVAFLHRNEFEADLFRGQQQNNLDLDKLTASTRDALKCGLSKSLLHPSIRYRLASDLKDYCQEVSFKNLDQDKDMVALDLEAVAFVAKVWSWIVAQKVDVLDESIKSLWLLPLTNGQYRKIKPAFPFSDTIFVQSGSIRDLLRKFAMSQDFGNKPLLQTDMISESLAVVVDASRRDSNMLIKDGTKLKDFLRWLNQIDHIVEQASDEDKMAIVEVVASTLSSTPIASSKEDILESIQSLPIFRKVSWKTDKGGMNPCWTWVRLNDCDCSVGLRQGILPIPEIEGVQFLDTESLSTRKVLQDLDLAKCLSTVEVLQQFIIPAWQGPQAATWDRSCKIQTGQLLFRHYSALDSIFRQRIKSMPIVPVICVNGESSPLFKIAAELIDPSVPSLIGLFFEEEEVLPAENFFKDFGHVLKECGLKSSVDDDLIHSRTRAYANSSHTVEVVHRRAIHLLKQARFPAATNGQRISELQTLRWLPVEDLDGNLAILAASQCRSRKDRHLVGFELSILEIDLSSRWNTCLGWDQIIPDTVLLAQLQKGIEKDDRAVVDAVLKYFDKNPRTKNICEDLAKLRCVLDTKGQFVTPSEAFRRGCDRLYPYLRDVDRKFWEDHEKMLVGFGIRAKPEPKDLLAIQEKLAHHTFLEEADQEIAIAILTLACSFPRSELLGLKVLCESRTLYPIEDVNYNDQRLSTFNEKVNLIHPKIARETANKLQIEPLSERLVKGTLELADIEDEDDFYQREQVTTSIADTLERYLPETTFKEYLANADDTEGSSEISWLLDKREHAKDDLLTEQLKDFQGPALLVHNNGVFSDDDFNGFKDVGRGSKRGNKSTIGQFGRGSQTMFHWTDVPMLLSGKWLLILDPLQKNLPMNYRQLQLKPGVKIPLSKIRQCHPNQLAPFEGLWGYTQDLDEYPGTIFRFPLRKSGSILKENGEWFDSNQVQRYMTAFFDEARISLLFLRRVCSMNFKIYGESRCRWSVSRQSPLDEEAKSFSEWVVCRFTKDEESEPSITGTDRWWVAIEDLDPVPSHLQYPQTRVMKSVECGIAALISTTLPAKESKPCREIIQSRLFSTLPLMISSQMPVHIHATFSLSSDRRALVVSGETTEPYGSKWNSWLLDSALPTLYLAFLDDLGRKIGADVFCFWPEEVPPVGSPSELLYVSFWRMLTQSSKRLFPRAQQASTVRQRKQPQLLEFQRAMFDFLPTESSQTLAPLLQSLLPELVAQVPTATAGCLRRLGVKYVTPNVLQTLFRSEPAILRLHEETLQNPAILDVLLSELITDKESFDELNGCQILPLANGSWGKLIVGDPESAPTTYFVANQVERELFDFASELLVTEETGTRFKLFVDSGKFNVTKLKMRHLSRLLKKKAFDSKVDGPKTKLWLGRFWEFWNRSKEENTKDQKFIHTIGLDQYPIFEATRDGITKLIEPSELDKVPAVVEPCEEFHKKLCDLTPGLFQFNPSFMPTRLSKSEGSFLSINSFQRFMKALSMLAGGKDPNLSVFASEHLITEEMMEEFQELVQHHVNTSISTSQKAERSSKFTELKLLLRQLPLWPTGKVDSVPTFSSASEALIAGDFRLMVSWIPSSAKFIERKFWNQETYRTCLQRLDIRVVEAETLLQDYVFPHLPPRLSVDERSCYGPLISAIVAVCGQSDYRKKPVHLIEYLKKVKLAADQKGNLHFASDLFDHQEPIFVSAFGDKAQTTFLHSNVQHHRSFWLTIGLRHKLKNYGSLDVENYIKCINALNARLEFNLDPSTYGLAIDDIKVVLGPLINMGSECRVFSTHDWLEIRKWKVFVSMGTDSQPEYRRVKMLAIAKEQPLSNLDELISHDYISVCWSQSPFATHQPTKEVLNNICSKGKPSLSMVWKHVEFLTGLAENLGKADIEGFLDDLHDCYYYLETHLSQAKDSFTLRDGKIWLNLHDVEGSQVSVDELKTSWMKLEHLLLSSSSDAPPYMSVRPGLMRYEKLLKELGCGSVVYPVEDVPNAPAGPAHSMISLLQKMRRDGKMLDITLRAGDIPIRAHKVVLAASSEYCATLFGGNWSVKNEIELGELSHHALSTMIKAAYEEVIDWTEMEVRNEDDNEAADKKLELLLDIYQGADYWRMAGLAGQVEIRIRRAFRKFTRLDSVEDVMERASEVNAAFLVSLCEKFCTQNRKLLDARFQ